MCFFINYFMCGSSFSKFGIYISFRLSVKRPWFCKLFKALDMLRRVSHIMPAKRSIFMFTLLLPSVLSHRFAINAIMRPSIVAGVYFHIELFSSCTLRHMRFKRLSVKMFCFVNSLKK